MYPTAVRTTGVGVANSLSNVGAVIAPFVVFGLVSRGAAGTVLRGARDWADPQRQAGLGTELEQATH